MDEHRATGAARNVGGKVEEAIGRATGDAKGQVLGAMDRAQGAAENLYGQTKDAASDAAVSTPRTTAWRDRFMVYSSGVRQRAASGMRGPRELHCE